MRASPEGYRGRHPLFLKVQRLEGGLVSLRDTRSRDSAERASTGCEGTSPTELEGSAQPSYHDWIAKVFVREIMACLLSNYTVMDVAGRYMTAVAREGAPENLSRRNTMVEATHED